MANFKTDNIIQRTLLDVDFLEIIGTDTFEFSLYQLLERRQMLIAFEIDYKNDHVGRKAYPPKVLMRIIFYAYYRGITSSRVIASLCRTDLKFMALAGGDTPHFTTIADFVSSKPDAIADVFQRVLLVCDESGLIGKEHFAIDGCKISSDASKQWSGKHKELARKSAKMKKAAQRIVDKHRDSDNRKGDMAKEPKQTVETLLKNAQKIDDFLAENEPRVGEGKSKKEVQSNITDNESAKMSTSKGTIQGFNAVTAADEKHQIVVTAECFGAGPEQQTLAPTIEAIEQNLEVDLGLSNTVVTADTGFSSEQTMEYLFEKGIDAVVPDNQFRKRQDAFVESETYNRQKDRRKRTRSDRAQSEAQLPASEFKVDLVAKICICPAGKEMMYHGEHEGTRGAYSRFRGKLGDCRDCPMSESCMKKPVKGRGRQVQFLNKEQTKSSYTDLMKQKIDSEEGARRYSHRMWTIEPVFGNICSNKRLDKFSLRGKKKVTGQWLLCCLVHNLEKLWRYGSEAAIR